MGETRLQRVRRFYRSLESLAALDNRHRAGRNVYDDEHLVRDRSERGLDAEQQMVRLVNQRRACYRSWLDVCPRLVVRQMAPQHWRVRDASGLWRADLSAVAWSHARRIEKLSPASARAAHDVDLLLLQYFQQTLRRRVERIRICCHSRRRNALPCARYRPLGPDRVADHRIDVHSRHKLGACIHRQ